jgi:hypothetical protein
MRRASVPLGVITVEDPLELSNRHPGPWSETVIWAKLFSRVRCTRISLPDGAKETALSIRFSAMLSIISSVPRTRSPGTRSADMVRS